MAYQGVSAHDRTFGSARIHLHDIATRTSLLATLALAMACRLLAFSAARRLRLATALLAIAVLTFEATTAGLAAATAATARTAFACGSAFKTRLMLTVLASFASRTLVATLIVATRLLLLLATRLRRAARFDASAAAATLFVFIHVGRKLRQRRIVAAIGARDFLARRALDVA